MIFNMYYFIMHVDYMREYKHVSYTTCRWYTTCLFVLSLGKPNIWRIQHFDVQLLWMSTFCWQQWDQHLWFIAAVTSSTDRSIFCSKYQSPTVFDLGIEDGNTGQHPWHVSQRFQQCRSSPQEALDCSHGQSTCPGPWTQKVWAQMSSTTCLLTTTWTPGGWRSQQRSTQPSKPETGLPTTLRGNTMCPRWDELIMSPTPSTAICNMFYHATELHIESNNWQQAKLLALCTNSVQQKRRIGNGTINLFNRGYFMETQMQVEAGHFLNLTTDEFSTVQLWNITASTTGGNILQKIANATSWQQHTCAHSTGDWTSTWMAPGPHQRLGVHRNASTQQDANRGSTAFEPGLGEPTSSPTRHSTSILGGQDIRAFSWQPNDPGICQCQHQHGSVQHWFQRIPWSNKRRCQHGWRDEGLIQHEINKWEKLQLPWLNSLKQQRWWWAQQAVQHLRVPTNRLYTNTFRQQSFVNTLV